MSSNMSNLIMNVLPDNRPITFIQIVEHHEKCPRKFQPVHRTYDEDGDADLYRLTPLFGKRICRYLCLSKEEGLPEYIVETLKVINERELAPLGYSVLARTADTDQKAWRKRQITYKLSKRGSITTAVTDIILCSKLKAAPAGFQLAGEINGILVCFKLGPVTHRPPPNLPTQQKRNSLICDLENSLHYVNISQKPLYPLPEVINKPLPPTPSHSSIATTTIINQDGHKIINYQIDDYEEIQSSYQMPNSPSQISTGSLSQQQQNSSLITSLHLQSQSNTPIRTAPPRPPVVQYKTLGTHSYLDGVPFTMSSKLLKQNSYEMPSMNIFLNSINGNLSYDFQLERQILCTTKTATTKLTSSTNPFFK